MKNLVFFFLFSIIFFIFNGQVAYGEENKWRVGFLVGDYDPSLETLNSIIANPEKGIVQDPNFLLPRSQAFLATDRNISTSALDGKMNFGIEVERMITERHSLLFTLSVWNGESVARDTIPLFLRADQVDPFLFPREARYNLVINQIWMSWRYHLLNNPKVGRVFFNIGVAGFALADLTIDALVKVVCPESDPECVPPDPGQTVGAFASTSSTEASGFGFSTHFGLGGEYYLTKWLSIGANLNYVIGDINDLEIERIFPSGFEVLDEIPPESLFGTVGIPLPPPVPEEGGTLTYANITVNPSRNNEETIRTQRPVSLELDGLNIVGLIRIHF